MVDAVFKALADPTRRDLLDALFAKDGQTLAALEIMVPALRDRAIPDALAITLRQLCLGVEAHGARHVTG